MDKIELKQNKSIIPKSDLSRFFMSLNYFSNYFNNDYLKDSDFDEYLVWLYHYNNHSPKYIKKIYDLVENAARNWNGDPKTVDKVIINVGKKQTQYRVFKDFEVIPDVTFLKEKYNTLINKFI